MSDSHPVPGSTPRERAVLIAGALAEAGAHTLRFRASGVEHTIRARETDLVGEVLRAGQCELDSPEIGITVRVSATGAEWRGENASFERAMRRGT